MMLNRDALEVLPEILVKRIENAGEYAFKKLGEHIKKIGHMTASDVHRIEELHRAGLEAEEIQQYIEKVMQQNISDVFSIYTWTCQENLNKSKSAYDYRGLKNIPYSQNIPFQRIVQSMARRTAGDFLNLSQTTALSVLKGGKTVSLPLKNGYFDIIDQAITNVSLGVEGYQSALRNILKTVGEGGIRTVEYESGLTRRLDSAVRMNVLEGIRQVNQGTQDLIGEEIGSDGVEISAHGFCAPDHEDIQGKQLADKEYEEWNKAHEYPKRQIGKLNCHHYAFRIIIGVDEPAYSEKELSEMAERNAKGITFEGKHYTMYEATQMQRKLETEIRRQKDVAVLAKSAENDSLRRSTQAHINLLSSKYKQFSDAAGLEYKAKRMSRADFRRVKTNVELTSSKNSSIMNYENEQSPRKQKKSDYSVRWDRIQTEEYKARLSAIIDNEDALSAVETRAKWALDNRDGVNTEELYAINLSNGAEIGRIANQHFRKRVKRTPEFTKKLNEADVLGNEILLLHNHPDGLPPSIFDINALKINKNVAGITVGHDGSLYYYTRPHSQISIDDWNTAFETYSRFTQDTAEEKALEQLSEIYGFKFIKL